VLELGQLNINQIVNFFLAVSSQLAVFFYVCFFLPNPSVLVTLGDFLY